MKIYNKRNRDFDCENEINDDDDDVVDDNYDDSVSWKFQVGIWFSNAILVLKV